MPSTAKIEYHRLPQPFLDIAVIQTNSSQQIFSIFHTLKQHLEILGLSVYLRPTANCIIILGSTLAINPQLNQTLFSGLGIIDNQFYRGPQTLQLADQANIGESIGLFTAIKLKDDEIIAHQDFFGQGQHYYYSWGEGALITNRLHLAATILAETELPAVPNRLFIHTLLLDHPFFSHQSFTHETPIQGLKRLPINYDAIIKNGHLSLKEKQEWSQVFSGAGNYEDHLAHAQEEVLNNVAMVVNSQSFDIIAAELSGGKDSRMMLSAFIKDQKLKETIKICTRNVPQSQDLDIACKISEIFDLEFHSNEKAPIRPIPIETSLSVWRSFALGDYNTVVLTDFSCFGNNDKEIYLAGGCGELLRGYWHKIISSTETESIDTVIRRLLQNKEVYLHKTSPDLKAEIVEYVIKQLEFLTQENSLEAFNRHYLFFRNRAHFGLQFHGYSTFHRAPSWMPLMAKSLMKATYCLNFEDRAAGKLIYDFIAAHDTTLANIEYDAGFPYAEEQKKTSPPLNNDIIATANKRSEWTATRNKVNAAIKQASANHPVTPVPVKTRLLHRSAAEALARLERLFPQYEELFAILLKSLGYKSLEFPRETAIQAAKIIALQDIFLPLAKHQENIPVSDLDIGQYLTPLQSLSVSPSAGKITVEYELFADSDPGNYQFACYLLKGEIKEAIVWYGAHKKFEFDVDHDNHDVIVFAKHKHGNVFRLETNPRPV